MIDERTLKLAAEAIEAEALICGEWDELVITRETIGDFIAAQGTPRSTSIAESGLPVFEWTIGKKTLAVVDCGEERATLFL